MLHAAQTRSADPPYWFTIGGALEPGETPRQAAARELREEAGIDLPEEDLGSPFAEETIEFDFESWRIRQEQVFFAVALPHEPEPRLEGLDALERAVVDAAEWVDVADLASGRRRPANERLVGLCQEAVSIVRSAGPHTGGRSAPQVRLRCHRR